MLFNNSDRREFKALRQDAARMMGQVAELSDKIALAGQEGRKEIVKSARTRMQEGAGLLGSRVARLSKDANVALRGVDKTVRDKPYHFVLGAVALGLTVGLAFFAMRRAEASSP